MLRDTASDANNADNLNEAMRDVLDNLCAYKGWPVGHAYIRSEDDPGLLVPTDIWHLNEPERFATFREVTEMTTFQSGVGLPGRVLASGSPAWIFDVTKDPNFPRAKLADDIGVKAGFACPVLVGSEVIAVLEFFSAETVDPDQSLLDVLRQIGLLLGRVAEREQLDNLKNEFISMVSHELRTPLTSIKGSLGLIRAGVTGELPEKLRSMVEIAYNNSDRLVRLINDILDIEKIEAGKMDFHMEVLELMPMVEQAIEENKGFGDQHEVTLAITDTVPDAKVEGDRDRLIQVLTNLLSNAAKFSPDGERVEVSASRQDGGYRVAVTDHGPGIPEDFREKIFGKFSQADSSDTREKGGTGLGLSISKAIVEEHSGRIGFDTETGKGTTFFFDLPKWEDVKVTPPIAEEIQSSAG